MNFVIATLTCPPEISGQEADQPIQMLLELVFPILIFILLFPCHYLFSFSSLVHSFLLVFPTQNVNLFHTLTLFQMADFKLKEQMTIQIR